jgi:hypothetical protein
VAVGGADADFVLDGHLVELKTTSKLTAAEVRTTLRQLLGYTLLDFDDALAIRHLDVFCPRFGYLETWPIWSLLRPPGNNQLAWIVEGGKPGGPTVTERLAELRADMRSICVDVMRATQEAVASWEEKRRNAFLLPARRRIPPPQRPVPPPPLDTRPDDPDIKRRRQLAAHPGTRPGDLAQLASDTEFLVRVAVSRNAGTPASALAILARDKDVRIRKLVAANLFTPRQLLEQLASDMNEEVRWTVARNPCCPTPLLTRLASDEHDVVRRLATEQLAEPEP